MDDRRRRVCALAESLAASGLTEPHLAWAFLVIQGFVRGARGDEGIFLAILAQQVDAGLVPDGIVVQRVTQFLLSTPLVLRAAREPYPSGQNGHDRWTYVLSWLGRPT